MGSGAHPVARASDRLRDDRGPLAHHAARNGRRGVGGIGRRSRASLPKAAIGDWVGGPSARRYRDLHPRTAGCRTVWADRGSWSTGIPARTLTDVLRSCPHRSGRSPDLLGRRESWRHREAVRGQATTSSFRAAGNPRRNSVTPKISSNRPPGTASASPAEMPKSSRTYPRAKTA